MRIFTNPDGTSYVNAISQLAGGKDVEGHVYCLQAGLHFTQLNFQQGPVPVVGVNGVTNEMLLAILIHRTKYLNEQNPCAENERAIAGMQAALDAFEERAAKRIARGVA